MTKLDIVFVNMTPHDLTIFHDGVDGPKMVIKKGQDSKGREHGMRLPVLKGKTEEIYTSFHDGDERYSIKVTENSDAKVHDEPPIITGGRIFYITSTPVAMHLRRFDVLSPGFTLKTVENGKTIYHGADGLQRFLD